MSFFGSALLKKYYITGISVAYYICMTVDPLANKGQIKMRHGKDTKLQANKALSLLYKLDHNMPEIPMIDKIVTLSDIVRLSKSYHTLQEKACNVELNTRDMTREKNIEREITELAAQLNLSVMFTGDPRGYCVKLIANDVKGFYNTWGGQDDGYGIG